MARNVKRMPDPSTAAMDAATEIKDALPVMHGVRLPTDIQIARIIDGHYADAVQALKFARQNIEELSEKLLAFENPKHRTDPAIDAIDEIFRRFKPGAKGTVQRS